MNSLLGGYQFYISRTAILISLLLMLLAYYSLPLVNDSAQEMQSRIVLVTGATDGIGKHTATRLAQAGATVLLHGRSKSKLDRTVKEIREKTRNKNLDTFIADFSSLADVHNLSEAIHQRYRHLDVLINNAGVIMKTRQESRDGYEMTFAVNVLAPFLLTSLLLDLLKKGTASRIVNVSSISQAQTINFDDLQFKKTPYGYGVKAYKQSKVCEVIFTYEMSELLKDSGITINSLHPGTVNTKLLVNTFGPIGRKEEADGEFNLATHPAYDGITGKYFVDGKEQKSSPITYDKNARKQLWDILVMMTGADQDNFKI